METLWLKDDRQKKEAKTDNYKKLHIYTVTPAERSNVYLPERGIVLPIA